MTDTELTGVPGQPPEDPSDDVADRPRRRRAGGLDGMVLAELQQLAGSLGITGTGRMRKGQLVEAIRAAQGSGTGGADDGRPAAVTEPTSSGYASGQAPSQPAPPRSDDRETESADRDRADMTTDLRTADRSRRRSMTC